MKHGEIKRFIQMRSILRKEFYQQILFLSLLFFSIATVATILHYNGIWYGNSIMSFAWIASALLLLISATKNISFLIKSNMIILIFSIATLYFLTHLWNFNTAPWNSFGLFDDAAWDIYYAKNKVLTEEPFQAAYFDQVGYISREVVFHYYITFFFTMFGYNLLVFNFSLLVLGFVTVIATTLLVHNIFNKYSITIVTALVLNFFPFHFMHTFMGHRYSIAAPLMMLSLYFLFSGIKSRSYLLITFSSLFAALCWSSAIMGKQFLLGIFGSAICILLFDRKRITFSKITFASMWLLSFLICSMPLWVYIIFNYSDYTLRESGLVSEFIEGLYQSGYTSLLPYKDQLLELFFAPISYRRQFIPDFPLIPFVYYPFLLIGMLIMILKKRFELLLLAIIPTMSAFVSGAYDFRVLLSVPIWIVSISYALDYISISKVNHIIKIGIYALTVLLIGIGLFHSISYIHKVSSNPHHLYLLPHKDVAISRVVQDIVLGRSYPSNDLKKNEFMLKNETVFVHRDALVCPYSSYAIMHLYLQDYDDRKILSFCNQGVQLLMTHEEILHANINSIDLYTPSGKDLLLVWERSDKSDPVISKFRDLEKYGTSEIISDDVEGVTYSLYILTIPYKNIQSFRNAANELITHESLRNI